MPGPVDLSPHFQAHLDALHDALAHEDRDLGVHGARRAIKALRALLRLTWPADPAEQLHAACASLDQELKTLADALAPARDVRVAAACALSLIEETEEEPERAALTRLAAEWLGDAARRESASDHLGPEQARRSEALIATHLQAIPTDPARSDVAMAMGRSYSKARRRMRAGLRGADADLLHAARRELVRLQIQIQALGPELGGKLRRLGRKAGRLRQTLGDHHDMAELDKRIGFSDLPGRIKSRLLQAVEQRADGLSQLAAAQADSALRRKPKALRKRLARKLGG
ncbi:hypothetical protein SLNSH_05885 [Alsobacter soli]|uniref:CHAD domain-containing protein n=1 Tax=Alsobacter soli TaxID=2109933 RepID=A0A2T1HWE5_9HYPH|nr:CHAD domain-containing protein [Alsobacter soli]PSC05910.1 hypothetical protein SLNSH_05885 [Alsobacter soli]